MRNSSNPSSGCGRWHPKGSPSAPFVRCCVETRSLWCRHGGRHFGTWSGSRRRCRCELQDSRSSAYVDWSPPPPDPLRVLWSGAPVRTSRGAVRWVILPPGMHQYVSTRHVSPSSKVAKFEGNCLVVAGRHQAPAASRRWSALVMSCPPRPARDGCTQARRGVLDSVASSQAAHVAV